ncbi:hypothetical protein BN1723_020282, partial [Verticillium longisporum]
LCRRSIPLFRRPDEDVCRRQGQQGLHCP